MLMSGGVTGVFVPLRFRATIEKIYTLCCTILSVISSTSFYYRTIIALTVQFVRKRRKTDFGELGTTIIYETRKRRIGGDTFSLLLRNTFF